MGDKTGGLLERLFQKTRVRDQREQNREEGKANRVH